MFTTYSTIQTTTGNITLTGFGGNGTDNNHGLALVGPFITSASGAITLTGTGGNGSATTNTGIWLSDAGAGTPVSSTGSGAGIGAITLTGTAGGGTHLNTGIYTSVDITSVSGNMTLDGTGVGTGTDNIGTWVDGATISSTGTGVNAAAISIEGVGGAGTARNSGFVASTAIITSVDGDISIDGTGGNAANFFNHGIDLFAATISSTGTGADAANLTMTGEGGAGDDANRGIFADAVTLVTTVDGDIEMTGTGGAGTSSANRGILLRQAQVTSTGTGAGAGTILLEGNGGSGAFGLNDGIAFGTYGLPHITSVDGDITLTGTGGTGAGNDNNGVLFEDSSGIDMTGDANVSLTGAKGANTSSALRVDGAGNYIGTAASDGIVTLTMDDVTWGDMTIETDGDIVVKTRTVGTTIGVAGGAGALDLSTTLLADLDAGNDIVIGGGDGTGAMTINAYANWANIAGGGVRFASDSGVMTFAGVQDFGARDLSFETNGDPVLGAALTGTGVLSLMPGTAATTMGIAGGAGTVTYSTADIAAFGAGWTSYLFGRSDQTGALTTGANTWSKPVTWRSGAGGNIVISGLQDTTAASNATFTFDGPTTLSANVSTVAATGGTRAIAFNDLVTLGADAQVLAGAGTITFSDTVDGARDLTVSTTGAMTFVDDIGAGTPLDDLTLTSDADPSIGGTVAGTGILTLQQATNTTTMGVAGGAGALNYSAADLAGLGANWSAIRMGSPTATGALTVGAKAWESPVTYRAAAAGSIVITGAQTSVAASDTSFTFSGPVTLGANVSTAAATGGTQDITFSDDVTLTANAQVLAGSGDILVSGTIDGAFDLTLNAAGTVTLSDDVGAGTPLDDLTLASDADPTIGGTVDETGILTLQQASNATTMGVAGGAGALNYSVADLAGLGTNWTSIRLGSPTATGALTVGVHAWALPVEYRAAAAGFIVVTGAQTAVAASDTIFTFSGPTSLGANVSTVGATGGTQDITFNDDVTLTGNTQVLAGGGDISVTGTIDGAFDLTLSTTGAITLADDVGAVTPLDDLTLTSDADPTIGGTVEGTGILTLQQASAATTMGVAGGAGALNYSLADLAALGTNWTTLRLGSTSATGTLTVGANAWDIPVDYRAAAAGSIVISGAQTAGAASDTIFTFSGPATINAPLDLTNATGGTQTITFNGTAAVNADITSGGGDVAFNDTLSLGADIATGGGDITLADDVTLTGTSSIDTDTADIPFAGTLDGTQDLTLVTMGDVSFAGSVGGAAALDMLTIADAEDITFLDDLSAADFILTDGTGAVLVTGAADLTGDIDLTTAGAVTFGDVLTFGGDVAVDSGGSDITFNGTVDGPGDFELTTTNDILFADNVGGTTRLGDVLIDPRHFTAGLFNAAAFTFTNGTGNVTFGGTGLNTTGDIAIDTNGNVTGTYTGANGLFDAGAGTITATVSFTGLDIGGAGATLSAGYIVAPGVADQAMANLISIDGLRNPWPMGIPNPAYTFAGFQIGAVAVMGGGGGGGAEALAHPSHRQSPILLPLPARRPVYSRGLQSRNHFSLLCCPTSHVSSARRKSWCCRRSHQQNCPLSRSATPIQPMLRATLYCQPGDTLPR